MMTCEMNNLKMKFVFSPDVILCGWQGSKHQLTNKNCRTNLSAKPSQISVFTIPKRQENLSHVPVCTPSKYIDRSQVQAFSGAHFGRGLSTSRIWLDNVRCTGYESRLTSCSANSLGVHNCDYSEDAGVSCGSASTGGKNDCETSVGIVNRTFKGTSLLETSVLHNW